MPSLASALRREVRRLASREMQKAMRPLRRVQRQVDTLRRDARGQRRTLATIERRMMASGGRVASAVAAAISPEAILALRQRLHMSRKAFAAVVGVSPGSIFGWEKGRTVPRGGSVTRLQEMRKTGIRQLRKEATVAPPVVRRRMRRSASKPAARRARR